MTRRIILSALLGVVAGLFIEIIIVVLASIWSFVSDAQVVIPGIYQVGPADSSGLRGLDFEPSFAGLAVLLVVVVLLFVVGAVYLGSRRIRQH